MTIAVNKRAEDAQQFLRSTVSFPNARTAFKAFMQALDFTPEDEILLPAYVGWSKNEGSGVFDPVQEIGVRFRFYRVARDLSIDLDDLSDKMGKGHARLLVVIHFFGYPDPHLDQVVSCAREHSTLVLEDEAHALYSDWIGGICGRLGDASIMSLHKMLPFEEGGLLVLNDSLTRSVDRLHKSSLRKPLPRSPWDYDLLQISGVRRRNAVKLLELIQPLKGRVDPLYPTLAAGVIPQTLPVLISGKSRDELYFQLNEQGYGVISLYHTLIEQIGKAQFPDSFWLCHRILNLPVHQDISLEALEAMVSKLTCLL